MERKESKCKTPSKPLSGQTYYLDVRPSKRNDQLKLQLKKLGGHLEDFLSKDVNFLVTDRLDGSTIGNADLAPKAGADGDQWLPETPASGLPSPMFTRVVQFENDIQFPDSPVTDSFRTPTTIQPAQSRGQALLERAVKHKTQKQGSADMLEVSRQWGIKIIPVRTLLQQLEHLLKTTLSKSTKTESPNKKRSGLYKLVQLHAPFIKVEDVQRDHRPFYRELQDGVELFLDQHVTGNEPAPRSEDENEALWTPVKESQKKKVLCQKEENRPIGLAAKAKDHFVERKKIQVPNNDQQRRKMGYCEICNLSYRVLSKHVSTKSHATFMGNAINFVKLRELVTELPTTKALRQKKRPLSDITQGANCQEKKDNEESSQKLDNQPAAKATKIVGALSSSSPLIRRRKASGSKGQFPEKLFSDSEDDYVEASCSTASCQIPGCLGGPLCLSGPLFKELSSESVPLQQTPAHCQECDCSCSSSSKPCQPAQAHQSSSSTVPFISLDIQPLNLSTKRRQQEDKENSPTRKSKKQSDLVFFSENACASSFGVKENAANGNSFISDANTVENNNTTISFFNVTFPGCTKATENISECATTAKTCVVNDANCTTVTSKQDICALQDSANVHSVRKALFMSDSTSPSKLPKVTEEPETPMFESSSKSFSQCSLSDQMLNIISSDADQPVLTCN